MTDHPHPDEPHEPDAPGVPVSRARLERVLSSSERWAVRLPRYADRNQRHADFWALAAGVLAAATSVAIWPVLSEASTPWEKVLVSVASFAAAVCALVPRVKGYAEQAGAARVLGAQYGSLIGRLVDLLDHTPLDQQVAGQVVAEYQSVKEKKDALRGLPFDERPGRRPPATRQADGASAAGSKEQTSPSVSSP